MGMTLRQSFREHPTRLSDRVLIVWLIRKALLIQEAVLSLYYPQFSLRSLEKFVSPACRMSLLPRITRIVSPLFPSLLQLIGEMNQNAERKAPLGALASL